MLFSSICTPDVATIYLLFAMLGDGYESSIREGDKHTLTTHALYPDCQLAIRFAIQFEIIAIFQQQNMIFMTVKE